MAARSSRPAFSYWLWESLLDHPCQHGDHIGVAKRFATVDGGLLQLGVDEAQSLDAFPVAGAHGVLGGALDAVC